MTPRLHAEQSYIACDLDRIHRLCCTLGFLCLAACGAGSVLQQAGRAPVSRHALSCVLRPVGR